MGGLTLSRSADESRAVAVIVTVYCAGRAIADLTACWQNAPLERNGGWAFLVWLLPALLGITARNVVVSRSLLGFGAVCALGAQITDLNALGHIGMASVLAAWLPAWAAAGKRRWQVTFWRVSALAWMPLLGWLMASFVPVGQAWSPAVFGAVRVVWAAVGTLLVLAPPVLRGLSLLSKKEPHPK